MRQISLILCTLYWLIAPFTGFCEDRPVVSSATQQCLDCHSAFHSGIVEDWKKSRHAVMTPEAYRRTTLANKANSPVITIRKMLHSSNNVKPLSTAFSIFFIMSFSPLRKTDLKPHCFRCIFVNTFQNKKAAKHESIVIAARPSLLPLRTLYSQTRRNLNFRLVIITTMFCQLKTNSFTDFALSV